MHREKLVRDNIPGIVLKQDPSAVIQVRTATKEEVFQLLVNKLDEEFTELTQSLASYDDRRRDSAKEPPFAAIILEAADVVEVILALIENAGIEPSELERMRKAKAESKGIFAQRLVMAQWKSTCECNEEPCEHSTSR